MDGRGRWMDNVFIERLWRSLKHEDIYLKGYADGREARAGIASWIAFYKRPHHALGQRTPMAVWRAGITGPRAMDMMDNARALPTCPQPQQPQQTHVLLHDVRRSERSRFQLRNRSHWSYSWGPPTRGVHLRPFGGFGPQTWSG